MATNQGFVTTVTKTTAFAGRMSALRVAPRNRGRDQPPMAVIHQSDLSAFDRCAHAYSLARAGNPGIQSSALAYGTVIHYAILNVFEREFRTGTPWATAVQMAVDSFRYYWSPLHIEELTEPVELWLPRQTFGGLLAKGQESIRWYAQTAREEESQVIATEIGFQVPIKGTWDEQLDEPHVLAGTIDILKVKPVKRTLTLSIEDLKSGKDYPYLRQNLQFTAYCVAPDTPVLMADRTWKRIEDLTPGERILACDEESVPAVNPTAGKPRRSARRWREATVEAAWGTVKPAYRLHLSDGTSIVAGAGHRFLARWRGHFAWRPVEDMQAVLASSRLHKNDGIQIAKVFRSPTDREPVDYESADYMAGYIAGATLGDGTIDCLRSVPYWRITLGEYDIAILDRLRYFLNAFGVRAAEFRLEPNGRGWQRQTMAGLRVARRAEIEAIQAMCAEPSDSDAYAAGWLAGCFDTDGELSRGQNQAGNDVLFWQKDMGVVETFVKRAAQLGFSFDHRLRDATGSRRTGGYARQRGDVTQRAEFLDLINPALKRKRIELGDRRLRVPGVVRVVRVEPLGQRKLIDIQTSTGTYIADGIVSHNCYATTQKEFWTGWRGEDGFGPQGEELYHRFLKAPRRASWISLKSNKVMDAGWRGPDDWTRFALGVEQFMASVNADIFPLSLNGENCTYCSFRDICAGVGVPAHDHGAP